MQVVIWLAVSGSGSWGKGWSLREAFTNMMAHADYEVHNVHLRRYTCPEGVTPQQAWEVTTVDNMGTSYAPKDAEVAKLDIAMPHKLYRAWKDWSEAWDSFTTTETMDEAFEGDLEGNI